MKLKLLLLFAFTSLVVNAQNELIKIKPKKVRASSAYNKYGPEEHAVDGKNNTYWNPKGKGNTGNGESIEIDLGSSYDIKLIKILPGVGTDAKWYKRNNRPKRISISLDGANEQIVDLKDSYGFQEIIINANVRKIEIEILERIVASFKSQRKSNYISEIEFLAINPETKSRLQSDIAYLNNNSLGYDKVMEYQNKNKNVDEFLFNNDVQKWKNLIEVKLGEAVKNDMLEYQNTIKNISPVFSSIVNLDQISNEIDNKYPSKYLRTDNVLSTKEIIKEKKSELVNLHYSKIAQKVNHANSLDDLNNIEQKYFNNINVNDAIKNLSKLISQNENRIKNEIEIRRQERIRLAEIRKQEQEEEARIAEEERVKELRRLMSETTETGEPTEWQMKFALTMQLEAKNKKLERMANVEAKDAFSALVGLFGSAAKGTRSELQSFEKYNCEKAQGKPGFNCDYVADVKVRGGMAESLYVGMLNTVGTSQVSTARFSKIKGIWTIVQFVE